MQNGFLAFSDNKNETEICNQNEYCLEKDGTQTKALICLGKKIENLFHYWSH